MFMNLLYTKYYSGDQMKKIEMGGACSTYGGAVGCILGLGAGNLRERGHLEDLGVDLKTVFKWIFQ